MGSLASLAPLIARPMARDGTRTLALSDTAGRSNSPARHRLPRGALAFVARSTPRRRMMRDRLELRAQDPVARCLIRQLIVPRIYFETEWPGLADSRVDVLAIDRDG